ncbi:hypothetical protein HUT16_15530 [Kitasatospora sp. NA04385]|uniref:pPIWI_RE_Y domain-containing protein n=1 Tax=Kitasatospora sp. NA04385 TaxID=2742135 RepID=UPI001590062F|nr:hypothetical protein [Kitasatospora sp. NA04385]QKW20291.1 hypothetical protein HUT16_15530 [Kitasatospora sp. NA04385]
MNRHADIPPPDWAALAAWSAYDGVPLLRTLAQALCLLEQQNGLLEFTLPYPAAAQQALDRTATAFLLHGEPPPVSLGELVTRCRTMSLEDWPLRLPPEVVGPGDRLLDDLWGRPTELCHEWAERSGDPAARHRDNLVIGIALDLCRSAGEEDSYRSFRGLLVRRPVLTNAQLWGVLGDQVLAPVHELVKLIYQPAPLSWRRDGRYWTCSRCHTLLVPVGRDEWWCERDQCRRLGAPTPRPVPDVAPTESVRQLERPLRQFVTGPGRAETELETELRAMGLDVLMWPGYDAYDLLVTFPDGWRWALDVKDRANPYFLGQSAKPVPRTPPYDEAFWVVPKHRVAARRNYLAAFERGRPAAHEDVVLVPDRVLIDRAAQRLRGLRGVGHA